MNVARIPLMIRMPGMKAGSRIKGIVQPWDLTATILDAFGVSKPPELIGNSLLPMINSETEQGRDKVPGNRRRAIRHDHAVSVVRGNCSEFKGY